MKIGKFAEKYHVSTDTIRFYIKVGLLSPRKDGSQMNFTEREEKEMEYILLLKSMQLNLDEIGHFLFYRRIHSDTEPEIQNQCIEILERKKKELEEERVRLKTSIGNIDREITQIRSRQNTESGDSGGVPLTAAVLLACPHCRKQLKIRDARIEGKYIRQGELYCDCGYTAKISSGIVETGVVYTGKHDTPDLDLAVMRDLGSEYNSLAPRCTEYMLEKISELDLHRKVVFEANINGYRFLYNHMDHLPEDAIYVIVDKYPEMLLRYKTRIESGFPGRDILYIADAGEHLPLAPDCIDLCVAMCSEMEYSFYHKHVQLHDIRDSLRADARIIGAYQSLPENSESRRRLRKKYPEGSDRMINFEMLKADYAAEGYDLQGIRLGTIMKTIKHHMYTAHVDGEPLTLYGYEAKPFQNGGKNME